MNIQILETPGDQTQNRSGRRGLGAYPWYKKNMMNLIGIGGYYQTILLDTLLGIMVLADCSHLKRYLHQ